MDDLHATLAEDSLDHKVLCRILKIATPNFKNKSGVQILLEPISNEADPIMSNQDSFFADRDVEKVVYQIWGKQILESLSRSSEIPPYEGPNRDYEAMAEYFRKNLEGKIICFTPSYRFDERNNAFLKKINPLSNSLEIFPDKKPDDNYFAAPCISEDTFNRLLRGESINLSDWICRYYGIPKYLDLGNRLIHCTALSQGMTNSISIDTSKPITSYRYLTVPQIEAGNLIVPSTENDYRFFSESWILELTKSSPTVIQSKTQQTIQDDEESDEISEETEDEESEGSAPSEQTKVARKERDEAILDKLWDYMRYKQLEYSREDINNFHTCMKSGFLTILAGMSGTGKTRLPLEYASFFGLKESDKTLLFLPISPSYTEPDDVLGYYNPADKLYVPSQTGLVDFLVDASNHPEKAHVVLFEEMNLARIEHWFAPFLSIMEKNSTDRTLRLYSDGVECLNRDKFPPSIRIGTNVIFVGTINIDETTTALSDRLLDRSMVINLTKLSFAQYSNTPAKRGEGANQTGETPESLASILNGRSFDNFDYIRQFDPRQIAFFDRLHETVSKVDPTKGVSFRSVRNIAIYLSCCTLSEKFTAREAFDYAVRQTLLRKVRGSYDTLSPLLEESSNGSSIVKLFDEFKDVSDFKLCRNELKSKKDILSKYGFVR